MHMTQIGFASYLNTEEKETVKDPWLKSYDQNANIFGKQTFVPQTVNKALNENTLVIGTSGTGKTYSFVEPNLLQGNANYVVADAKGAILNNIGRSLHNMGYQLQVLNLIDLKHSMTYNPFQYLKSEMDVTRFAQEIVATNPDGQKAQSANLDPYWSNAARALIESLIFFVKEELPEAEQSMATVTRLFRWVNKSPADFNEVLSDLGLKNTSYAVYVNNPDEDDNLNLGDFIFDALHQKNPESSAYKKWEEVRGVKDSEKTWASVYGIAGVALSAYSYKDVENLLGTNKIDFKTLLNPKTVLFILYDDADPSKNFISNILYGQLIHYLYIEAFKRDDNRLPVKVKFFLDDFKNINIPNFDDYLATARSRNISFCMMLQDESQLRSKFGSNYESVIGNCSAYLLTGTTDLTMATTAAARFNCTPSDIRLMDEDHFFLDIGGHITRPVRYDYLKHPNYINEKLVLNDYITTPEWDYRLPNLIEYLVHMPSVGMMNSDIDLDELINDDLDI